MSNERTPGRTPSTDSARCYERRAIVIDFFDFAGMIITLRSLIRRSRWMARVLFWTAKSM